MFRSAMNWNQAIESNQTALLRVLEEIFALLELVLDGSIAHLPQVLRQAAYRLLVPAESALRRLIVIAACGLQVKVPPHRAWPQNLRVSKKGVRPLIFQLYDTRKRFDRKPHSTKKAVEPRIHFFEPAPVITTSVPRTKRHDTTTRICRRFAAFKLALENIPHHAKRQALWQAKRAAKITCKFRYPLRPGRPPGWRRNFAFEIDLILTECHSLALHTLREAPS